MQGLGVSQMSHALDSGSRTAAINLGGGALGTTAWSRFERNIREDFQSVSGMTTWSDTDGIEVLMVGTPPQTYYVDMIRLSNSMTVEHNVLGPGVIAHILRNRMIAPSAGGSHTVADNWLHYDQVGSVMAISDAGGDLAERRYQDAWGNQQDGYGGGSFSGLWAAGEGWGHNTKETDGGTAMVYMSQRWYLQPNGVFVSSAPYLSFIESRFGFARNNPAGRLDPQGMLPIEQEKSTMIDCYHETKDGCDTGGCVSYAECMCGANGSGAEGALEQCFRQKTGGPPEHLVSTETRTWGGGLHTNCNICWKDGTCSRTDAALIVPPSYDPGDGRIWPIK